jgi:hypothetical protein
VYRWRVLSWFNNSLSISLNILILVYGEN